MGPPGRGPATRLHVRVPKRDTPERDPQDVSRQHVPEQYSKTRYRPKHESDTGSSTSLEESTCSNCEDSWDLPGLTQRDTVSPMPRKPQAFQ